MVARVRQQVLQRAVALPGTVCFRAAAEATVVIPQAPFHRQGNTLLEAEAVEEAEAIWRRAQQVLQAQLQVVVL